MGFVLSLTRTVVAQAARLSLLAASPLVALAQDAACPA
jgi:hypothetical protein